MASTTETTLTISISAKTATVSGLVALRETATVILTGIGAATPSQLKMYLFKNGTQVASCETFTASGSDATGSINLNTAELVALFGNVRPNAKQEVTVTVWDNTNSNLLCSDSFLIQQNPYSATMTAPTVLTAWTVPPT